MKKLLMCCFCIAATFSINAQISTLDSARNELYRINKVFDSSQYLGFNMDIFYKSDSAGTTKATDAVSGNYVLNKKNLYYKMGGIQYTQTDSFSYTAYADEKLLIMTKNQSGDISGSFPLRNFIDSVTEYYNSLYTVTIDTTMDDSVVVTKKILFTADSVAITTIDGNVPYTSFFIEYEADSYYPTKFQFSYNDKEEADSAVFYTAKKTVTMGFSHYKIYTNTQIFEDAQYAYYNRQRKTYQPAENYKDYRFVTSGFDNLDQDAAYYQEVPYNGDQPTP
ncbi:hypothetical protein [Ferruginibacter sp.]